MRVDERHAHFERVGHARPVHVAQELVAEIERRLQRRHTRVRCAGIGRHRALEDLDEIQARDAFAGDLPDEQVALIGATQRPVAELAFSEPSGPPAWKDRPTWAVVATGDRAAGADVVRSMAARAGARITEIDGSHVIMVSQPQAVSEVILEAVAAVASVPVEA